MEDSTKINEAVESIKQIFCTDYMPAITLLKEKLEIIQKTPEGKERNFLQTEYEEYFTLIDNQLNFKQDALWRMGIFIEDINNIISYVMPESEFTKIYDLLKDIPSDVNMDEDNIPHAK